MTIYSKQIEKIMGVIKETFQYQYVSDLSMWIERKKTFSKYDNRQSQV